MTISKIILFVPVVYYILQSHACRIPLLLSLLHLLLNCQFDIFGIEPRLNDPFTE